MILFGPPFAFTLITMFHLFIKDRAPGYLPKEKSTFNGRQFDVKEQFPNS
jgi:hypothetical protein